MMMTREQGQAVARLMSTLRDEWDEPGCLAAVAAVKDHEPHDVALAAIRLCATPEVKTPGALKVVGPHWRERVGATQRPDVNEWCATCNYTERICRQLYSDDHPYISVKQSRPGGYGVNEPHAFATREAFHAAKAATCSHGIPREVCKSKHDQSEEAA